jgi:galactofuranosylgalactofuranosylrhamnosyl-N-acetylglucosaminyl-diphospho-decaprenol beta-1,5/1,6-galactofuranosyltransferase
MLRQGVPTVTLPGMAVWHEPCERKGRGWHAYYELRNYLIVGALHFENVRAATVSRRFLSRLLDELLAYDYYESWLMCEAVAAYLDGPEILRLPPLTIHNRLQEMGEILAPKLCAREGTGRITDTLSRALAPRGPRAWRFRLVLRNFLLPSPSPDARPQRVLPGGGEQWYDVAGADVVGVAANCRSHIVLLRRSRGNFVRLFFRGIRLALRLLFSHRRAVRRWRAGASMLTSQEFWRDHLQMQNADVAPRMFRRGKVQRSLLVTAQITDRGFDRGNNE